MSKTLPYEQLSRSWVGPSAEYDYLFDMPTGKTNPLVRLTDEDEKIGVKILCKEPYAQELYEKYTGCGNITSLVSKDLNTDTVYSVRIVGFKKADKLVECEEITSGAPIYIPQNEFDFSMDMSSDEELMILTTKVRNGAMYGSMKKCKGVILRKRLEGFMANNTPFKVTVDRLIPGGFIAKYEDCVECFLPGAHAAPNIIYDFNSYVGKTIDVMIDNYDKTSEYFIVSHKKYIKHILPEAIHNLEFGKKYTGKLTSEPTKFGMFVEFEDIFTGLIHIAEFDNYEKVSKQYHSGDSIDFYITRISTKDGKEYKINLTTSEDKIDETTKSWMAYKEQLEGKTFDYEYDPETSALDLIADNKVVFTVRIPKKEILPYVDKTSHVKVRKVDIIDKNASFDLIE